MAKRKRRATPGARARRPAPKRAAARPRREARFVWWKDALRFVAVFAMVAGAIYLLTGPLSLFLRVLAANSSASLLQLFGVPAQSLLVDGEPLLYTPALSAYIVELCSARIEFAVLLGVILASADRSIRNRLAGALGAVLFVLLLNPIRIALTVQYFSPLVHDVVFRVTILVLVVGYYALWYLGPLSRWRG